MNKEWLQLNPGDVIIGHDHNEWTIVEVTGQSVTMEKPGQYPITGRPNMLSLVTVVREAPVVATRDAVTALNVSLGQVERESCGWCDGDPSDDCTCEKHCGVRHCVNFE